MVRTSHHGPQGNHAAVHKDPHGRKNPNHSRSQVEPPHAKGNGPDPNVPVYDGDETVKPGFQQGCGDIVRTDGFREGHLSKRGCVPGMQVRPNFSAKTFMPGAKNCCTRRAGCDRIGGQQSQRDPATLG